MSDYTISELSALSGLPVRTIRYYIAQGLVPAPGRDGPATRYPEGTLARLRLVTRLQEAHQPLAEIRKRLEALSDDEVASLVGSPPDEGVTESAIDYVRALLGETPAGPLPGPVALPASEAGEDPDLEVPTFLRRQAAPPGASRVSPGPKPAPPARSQWERIAVSPDIEIHLRRPLSRRDNRLAERLLAFARQLQGEDNP